MSLQSTNRQIKQTSVNICLLLFVFVLNVSAQQSNVSIFEVLKDTSELMHGKVVLHQDNRVTRMINCKILGVPYTANYILADGFRVQVFSGNEQHTAKATASRIEKLIQTKHPDLPIYVIFQSPFWKVRVGNCATNEEAQELRNFIQTEFPEMRRETYIVREQVRILN